MGTKKNRSITNLFAFMLAVTLIVAGCGGGGGGGEDPPMMPEPPPAPTAYEQAKAAIAEAETAEEAQAAYDAVDLSEITGEEAQSLQTALSNRLDTLATASREAQQKTALMNAAGMIDTSDLSTAEAIAAANTAIAALQAALDAADDVSDEDKAMYQTQLDTAGEAVRMAQTGLDTAGRQMTQREAISNAVTAARTAVAGVNDDSTDSEVAAADNAIAALEKAIADAVDLPEGDANVASAQGTLDTLKGTLASAKASRMMALDDADDAMKAAMARTGRLLRAALGGPDATMNALANISAYTLVATGPMPLSITRAQNAGTNADDADLDSVALTTGDSAGSLGGWAGTDYARSTGIGATRVTNEARVYTNKGSAGSQPFSGTNGKYTLITTPGPTRGYVELGAADTPVTRASAAAFTHSGTQTHQVPAESDAFYVSGTYDGAPGRFRCVSDCSSTNDGTGNVSALGGTWHFRPNAGAMVSVPDAHYLYYGWWVSKDSDGDPTAASAFTGRVGTDPGNSTDGLDNGWSGDYTAVDPALTGSATYVGHAVGKFAMSNALDGTGNGGHFTADAELNATFSGAATQVGVTGTIDNFRLNDGTDDPGWSVSLHRAGFGADGGITASTADTTNTTADGTTWSIDGNPAGESGSWSGQMYDEKPGDPSPTGPGDGSNIPTTVTGTFYSEFSAIGRMVGAFGANKQ